MRTMTTRPRALRIAAVAAAIGLALAACGADEDSEDTGEDESASSGDFMSSYISCIEEQGLELPEGWADDFGGGERPTDMPTDVSGEMPTDLPSDMPTDMPTDMPQGGFGGGFEAPDGVSDEDWQAAQDACAGELPSGGGFPGGDEGSDDLAAYRNCLAERDVELGDDIAELDESDPDVAAAMEECAALAPEETGSDS